MISTAFLRSALAQVQISQPMHALDTGNYTCVASRSPTVNITAILPDLKSEVS